MCRRRNEGQVKGRLSKDGSTDNHAELMVEIVGHRVHERELTALLHLSWFLASMMSSVAAWYENLKCFFLLSETAQSNDSSK